MSKIKAISLFSSAGIGELLLNNTNVDVVAANELLPKRADCYKHFYPNTDMHCGDITLDKTKEYMIVGDGQTVVQESSAPKSYTKYDRVIIKLADGTIVDTVPTSVTRTSGNLTITTIDGQVYEVSPLNVSLIDNK